MKLNQVTVAVTDYEAAVAFYVELGLRQIVAAAPRYARFETPSGETFSIHLADEVASSTIVYFEVEDVDAFRRRSASLCSTDPSTRNGSGARRGSPIRPATSSASTGPAKIAASRPGGSAAEPALERGRARPPVSTRTRGPGRESIRPRLFPSPREGTTRLPRLSRTGWLTGPILGPKTGHIGGPKMRALSRYRLFFIIPAALAVLGTSASARPRAHARAAGPVATQPSYAGSSNDGQSMVRQQSGLPAGTPGSAAGAAGGAGPTQARPGFVGGSDDGSSIRRRQPGHHGGHHPHQGH